MKIVVTSQCGRVGKSSISGNAFLPFMPEGTQFFSIESVNEGAEQFGVDMTSHRGSEIIEILTSVMVADNALLDVGASNFEEFFLGLSDFSGANEFDRFVIPTVPGKRESMETMKTVAVLESFGVPREKIYLVFNRVASRDLNESGEELARRQFPELFDFAKRDKSCIADPKVHLRESDLFEHLARTRQTIAQAMLDDTDYAAELKAAANDPAEKTRVKHAWAAARLAKTVAADCKRVYDTVTAGV